MKNLASRNAASFILRWLLQVQPKRFDGQKSAPNSKVAHIDLGACYVSRKAHGRTATCRPAESVFYQVVQIVIVAAKLFKNLTDS